MYNAPPEMPWFKNCQVRSYFSNLFTPLWLPDTLSELDGYEFEGWFLDEELSIPVGDKYGNVTEKDFEIFLNCAKKELYGVYRLYLYPKLVKL